MALSMTCRDVGRRPENEHAQVFIDVMESVLDAGRDEDQAARLHRSIFIRDAYRAPAADDVIDLVLFMWLLAIDRPRRPHREPDAELGRGEEVDVPVTLGVAGLRVELGNLVGMHVA